MNRAGGKRPNRRLGLFCREFIENRDPYEVIREIKRQGGIAVWPHPLRKKLQAPVKLLKEFDAVEAFNARTTEVKELKASLGESGLLEFLKKLNLPVVGGSDAHALCEVGNGRTVLPACRSLDEIKAAIMRKESLVEGEQTPQLSKYLGRLGNFLLKSRKIDKGHDEK